GVDEAIQAGKSLGIQVVAALVLDCMYDDLVLHVIGYYIDQTCEKYLKVEQKVLKQEMGASEERAERVRKMKIEVGMEDALPLTKDGSETGELIAEEVLNKPDSYKNPLLRPYLPGRARDTNPYVNFYWDYCAQGMPGYVHINYMSMEEA